MVEDGWASSVLDSLTFVHTEITLSTPLRRLLTQYKHEATLLTLVSKSMKKPLLFDHWDIF